MANLVRAALLVAPFALGLAGIGMLLLAAGSFIGSQGFAYDFEAYDLAARRIATGQELYPPGVAAAYNSGAYDGLYLYPPPLAVALVPLTAFAADPAALVWFALRLVAVVAAIAILPVSALVRGATLLAAGLSFPVWYDLNLGNLSIVVFGLSAVIWRFADRPAAAIALAVAGVLRYSFGIVLLGWAAAGRWRAVAWTIGGGLVIVAATLPVVGVEGWLAYVRTLSMLDDVSSGPHNLSLATTAAALGLPGERVVWVALGMGIGLLATLYASRRRDVETATVVALAATISFFPFFHPHYLVQLLIPAAFLASRGHGWALALPLLGWLPGEAMPLVAIAGVLLPLLPARGATAVSVGGAPSGGAAEFETGPMRP